MLSTVRATLLLTMTLTMQCHMTTKTFPVAGSGRSHSIKSSLVPVPETPKVLCIRLNEKGKQKVQVKQVHGEPPWESHKESERRMRRRVEGRGREMRNKEPNDIDKWWKERGSVPLLTPRGSGRRAHTVGGRSWKIKGCQCQDSGGGPLDGIPRMRMMSLTIRYPLE